jgi:hypothetical protein
VSSVAEMEGQQSGTSIQCTCGNSAEHGGIYPCDDYGRKLASSDLVYCDRCDKITNRETGRVVRYRSFLVAACGGM